MTVDPSNPTPGGSGRMLVALFRRYPGRSVSVLVALLVASLLDGVGLSTLLSMISLSSQSFDDSGAVLDASTEQSTPERLIGDLFAWAGIEATLPNLLAFGIGLILLKAAVVLLANRQVGYAVAQVATDLRLDLVRAVVASRWRYYLSKSVGSLANAMATEAQRASEGYLHAAIMATQIITAAVYAVVALLISWQVTLGALLLSAIVLGGLNLLVRTAGRAGRKQTGLLKTMLSVMTDQLAAIKPLKAMAREDQFDTLLSDQTEELNSALRKQVISKEAMKALQEALLVILAAIGLFVMLVRLDMPLSAVMILIFLLARITALLSKAQRAWQHLAIAESAFWSLNEAIEDARLEREAHGGRSAPALERSIEFDRVGFGHPGKTVFEAQSLILPAGGLTVLTGPSGSGKTTFIDLVAGLIQPDAGRVCIDGVDLAEIDRFAWRRQIGYVPQEALLVNDTIANNITLGAEGLDRDDVERALAEADALSFVEQLPAGLDSRIGERGGQLSGGQRQRLAIARALVHRPKLLILDEATSNLDAEAERAVLDTIDQLKSRLTLLAVTHHHPLMERADRLLVVRDGTITLSTPEPNATGSAS
ncbi:ABC transporter ATP-binding protein [Wenzhouxiangella sp. XN79A]|uniref:ABC transporter ATP-binding protein n=1 Tax=Wenzhouxiangella sp. XN79A TaxID=2724193 RepID=UPI00144AC8A8|nr:ABC transporter ATP-binding protein [Wenzhouxiangella sp. XN79A]NKI34383.1 ABC transporter ATP-binding protein [Wenzhouxiangella sp. XN79A]